MGSCCLRWPYSWLRFRVCFDGIQSGCAKGKWQVLPCSAVPIFVCSDAKLPYFFGYLETFRLKKQIGLDMGFCD